MPEISRFFGIVIRMFAEAAAQHHRPHFHAFYQDASVVVAIDRIAVLGGGLPRKQQRLVEAWAEIHLNELREDWKLLQSGRRPFRIAPLR